MPGREHLRATVFEDVCLAIGRQLHVCGAKPLVLPAAKGMRLEVAVVAGRYDGVFLGAAVVQTVIRSVAADDAIW